MSEHQAYTLLQDHRHYKKGDTVLLRDHVAEALAKQGKVDKKEPDKKAKAKAARTGQRSKA